MEIKVLAEKFKVAALFISHLFSLGAVTSKRSLCPWDPCIQIPAHLWTRGGTRCAYICEFSILKLTCFHAVYCSFG